MYGPSKPERKTPVRQLSRTIALAFPEPHSRLGGGARTLRRLLRSLLLDLAHLGQHHFPKDRSPSNPAQTPFMRHLARRQGRPAAVGRQRLAGGFLCVGGHVAFARDVLVLVFLHLEGLDTVRELDELDAAAQPRLGDVRPDLGQDVVVSGGVAGDPDVLEGLFAGGALVGVGLQKAEDEGFGFLADFLPVALVENDATCAALFDQVGKVLGSEG